MHSSRCEQRIAQRLIVLSLSPALIGSVSFWIVIKGLVGLIDVLYPTTPAAFIALLLNSDSF